MCGDVFTGRYTTTRYCSAYCQKRANYLNNKAKRDAKTNEWHRKHRARVMGYIAKSRAAKPELYRAIRRSVENTRRARIYKAGGKFTGAEWQTLSAMYGNCCLACCRGGLEITADHVVPVSRGGSNHITNIQPLCRPCNIAKFQKTIDFRADHLVGLA